MEKHYKEEAKDILEEYGLYEKVENDCIPFSKPKQETDKINEVYCKYLRDISLTLRKEIEDMSRKNEDNKELTEKYEKIHDLMRKLKRQGMNIIFINKM